jgi:outer membrane protein OmpA-like peptidoglycan-associated protein
MNTSTIRGGIRATRMLAAVALAILIVGGCASAPQSPPGAAEVRAKLSHLQSDQNLANLAPAALKEAEVAVRLAEEPVGKNTELGAHRVYMADRKVEIAMAKAATRYAEERRVALGEARAQARLDARTREADQARSAAELARSDASAAAERAAREAEELQRQIEALKAEATDRGLVLTLGDVLFAFDSAELKAGAASNLDQLIGFLNQYPTRNVQIEGHTDNVGSTDYNQRLSQRRAESVKSHLVRHGIASDRVVTSGKGQYQPVASNDSEAGRQQNRRVEIIIENPPAVSASSR